jgi:plastocyanin
MKKLITSVIGVLVVSVILTACAPKAVKIDVAMKEFAFVPDTITVPAGVEVTLNLSNIGNLEHEMIIMSAGKEATAPFGDEDQHNIYWEAKLDRGETETVTFTAPSEPGEYQIVCGTPGHLELGMKGLLIVK